jgi:hypothetical protein
VPKEPADRERAIPIVEKTMSKITIIALAAAALAPGLAAHAGGNRNEPPENSAASRCIANADGQPGRNNQGPGAGQGGKGGAIVLNGEQPGGCISANGGKGGNGNRGSNAGRGGGGGTIRF